MGVDGPFWSGARDGGRAGRYPLSVERHVMSRVAQLLPGVTTVTPHARYYTLHALAALEAHERGLVAAEAAELLRRTEVVMGAVTYAHGEHRGFGAPHGGDAIGPAVASGSVDVTGLSARGQYSRARWGYWGPYRGSEALLGLAQWSGDSIAPADGMPTTPFRKGFDGLLALAAEERLDVATLHAHSHLCLCAAATQPDGALLRQLLVPVDAQDETYGFRRAQTVKLLLRLFQLSESRSPTRDLWPRLVFAEEVADDDVCQRLVVTPAWQGVVLRGRSVAAWRDLWSWLVSQIAGLMPIHALLDTFAERVPDQSVSSFVDGLPDTQRGRRSLPAEVSPTVTNLDGPLRFIATLALGAARSKRLPDHVDAYFEGQDEAQQQLTPSWMATQLADWTDRSLPDFARYLAEILLRRSQRVALAKAGFSARTGTFDVPSRVLVRDGFVFRYSNEGGGPVGLRWDQLTTVMAGVGLVALDDDGVWRVTPSGEEVLA